jgi:hypothetical protein
MRCVECGSERDPSQHGWVTVLSPSGSLRVHYCPDCMSELVTRGTAAAEIDDHAKED